MWRDIQSAALPLGFFMIALNTYTYIDTVILGLMRTDTEIGWYAASYSVYEGLTYAPSILAAVLTPRLSYLFGHDRPRIVRSSPARCCIAGRSASCSALRRTGCRADHHAAVWQRYAPAALPLQILAGGALFVICDVDSPRRGDLTNLDRRLLVTTIAGLGTNVALNIA